MSGLGVKTGNQLMKGNTMTKLSKAQSKAVVNIILDEYVITELPKHETRYRRGHGSETISQATYKALVSKGVLVIDNNFDANFTDTGRTIAIDLLHEGATAEMADDFRYRQIEETRKAAELKIKHTIMHAHGLWDWEIEVTASYRLRDMSLRYSVDLAQRRVGRPLSDLVSIGWSYDEYTVDTTMTSLTARSAKRMGELMLIAAQVIESGILISPELLPGASIYAVAYGRTRSHAQKIHAIKWLRERYPLGLKEAKRYIDMVM